MTTGSGKEKPGIHGLSISGGVERAEARLRAARPATFTPAQERQALGALQLMARHDAWLAHEALSIGGRWRLLAAFGANVAGRHTGSGKRLGELAQEVVELMSAHGLIEKAGENRWRASAAGLRWMRARTPAMTTEPAGGGATQERARPPRKARQRRLLRDEDTGHLREVKVNTRENPLMWLARRKDAQGRALLEPHHVAAGEKLRADYETACMSPRVTANYDAAFSASDRSRLRAGPRDPFPMSERVIAARERIWRMLKALPAEQAEIVLRVCCLSEGLEAAERALNWPRRSARLILRMALEQLAAAYGIAARARSGQDKPAWRKMLSWHAPGGQPEELVPRDDLGTPGESGQN